MKNQELSSYEYTVIFVLYKYGPHLFCSINKKISSEMMRKKIIEQIDIPNEKKKYITLTNLGIKHYKLKFGGK